MSTSTTSHADATTSSWATNTTAGTLAAFGIETLTYEAAYKANLLCFLVLSSVTIAIAVGGIALRFWRGRRHLIARTARPEGDYFVPNGPIISAICIILFCIIAILFSGFSYAARVGVTVPARNIRITALLLPFPLFAWVHFSSFGPLFACHLFPLDTTAAVRPRLAKFLRFRPSIVNFACYSVPLITVAPVVGVAAGWAQVTSRTDDLVRLVINNATLPADRAAAVSEYISLTNHANMLYRGQWLLWAVLFGFSLVVYCLYTALLLPVLIGEIQNLTDISDAQAQHSIALGITPKSDTTTSGTTTEQSSSYPSKPSMGDRRPSWMKRSRLLSISSHIELNSRLSKFDLLKLNTRIVTIELAVFAVFCVSWITISLYKGILADTIVRRNNALTGTIVAEIWIGLVFGMAMVVLICRRGHNAMRVTRSPDPNNALRGIVSRDLVFLTRDAEGEGDKELGCISAPLPSPDDIHLKLASTSSEEGDEEEAIRKRHAAVGPRGSIVHFSELPIVLSQPSLPKRAPIPTPPPYPILASPFPPPSPAGVAKPSLPATLHRRASSAPLTSEMSDSPVATRSGSGRLATFVNEPGRSLWQAPMEWGVGEDGEDESAVVDGEPAKSTSPSAMIGKQLRRLSRQSR